MADVQRMRRLGRRFKREGLTLTKQAAKGLARQLRREDNPDEKLNGFIDAVKVHLDRQQNDSSVINADTVEIVVAALTKDEEDADRERLQLYSAFKTPKIIFNSVAKCYEISTKTNAKLHASAQHRIDMFRERLSLLTARVLRNKLFAPPVLSSSKADYVKIIPIESLIGSSGTHCLLGMLSQIEEGKIFLEDVNARVELDLSECQSPNGLFTEGCVVLVEGEMVDDRLRVHMIGFPPSEKRQRSLQHLTSTEVLGVIPFSKEYVRMQELEAEASDSMFVMLSNVHLDQPQVLKKLHRLFEGFEPIQPTLFVLIGNFLSKPFGHGLDDVKRMRKAFDDLSDILIQFPRLVKESYFVFVPGPSDPGSANVLPRPQIPQVFTRRLRARVKSALFTTNPCRLRFYSQEIVIFRENLVSKMRRHCLLPPLPGIDITAHLAKTIVDQSYLCPLPLSVRPVYWAYDHALRLFPQPDVLFLADHYDQYQQTYMGSLTVNPGHFPTDFSFVVYRPSQRKTEFSRV